MILIGTKPVSTEARSSATTWPLPPGSTRSSTTPRSVASEATARAPRHELDARSTGRAGVSSEIDEHHESPPRPTSGPSPEATLRDRGALLPSPHPPLVDRREVSKCAGTQAADDMSRHGRAHLTCSSRFAGGLVSDRRHVLRCRGATPRRPRRGCPGRSNPAAIRASERSRETAVPGSLIAEAVISRQGWFSGWEAARASGHLRSPSEATDRMKLLIPASKVSAASCSAQAAGGPWRKPLPDPNSPLMLYTLRTSAARRPARSAASSIRAPIAASSAGSA
jgi:hypothetical protein